MFRTATRMKDGASSRRRRLALLAGVTAAGLALAGCSAGGGQPDDGSTSGPTKELVIASHGGKWGDALKAAFIEPFEQETGVKVTFKETSDFAASTAAMDAGKAPAEDIIDVAPAQIETFAAGGYMHEVDYSGFDQDVLKDVPDFAKLKYGTSFGQIAIAMCYTHEAYPEGGPRPSGWKDFFDTAAFPGKRGVMSWLNDPTPEFGLIAAGVSTDDLYPLDVDRAFAQMAKIKGDIPQFAKDPTVLTQQLIDNQVSMAECLSSRVSPLVKDGAPIEIVWDDARLQSNTFGIWKGAKNAQNAQKFLDFVLRPDRQAAWAEIVLCAPINPKALDELPADVVDVLPNAPSHKAFQKDDAWYLKESAQDKGKNNLEALIARAATELG